MYSMLYLSMTAVRLNENTERRLGMLAERTGRTKSFYIREAIEQHLQDLEDYYLAADRARNPGRIYTSEEIERELGLQD